MYNVYSEPSCQNSRCAYFNICDQVPAITKQSEYREQYSPVDYLFLTEYPTWRESRYRTLWAASVGQVVRETLEQTCPAATYTVTSSVRAWPYQGSSLPSWGMQYNGYRPSMIPDSILQKTKTWPVHTHPQYHEIVHNCRPFWERDIEVWKPKQIVVMGNIALEAMFPNLGKSLLDLADTTLEYKGIPVRFITSPHFILLKPSLKNSWTKNFRRILLGQKQAYFDYHPETVLLDTVEKVKDAIREMRESGKPICIDTETANLNKRHGAVLGMIQMAVDSNRIFAVPWIHYETPFTPDQLEQIKVLLYDLFTDFSVPYWITYNGKFELNILENSIGCGLNAKIYDAQCGEFLLDENRADRRTEFKYGIYTLKQVSLDRLGYDGWNQDVLASRGEGSLMDLPLQKILEYGCTDVGLTMLVHEDQIREAREIQNYDKFLSLVFGLYNPIMRVFSQVERDGFPASLPYIRSLIQRNSPLLTKLKELQEEVLATPEGQRANKIILDRTTKNSRGIGVSPLARIPTVFDFAKTGHPQVLFFDVLGLKPTKYAEGGTPSVDDEFQEAYKATQPLVAKFSEWIEIKKMFDSFAKQLYDYLDPAGPHVDSKTDQRIRPSFQVSKVITGRIACSEPNIQACVSGDTLVVTEDGLVSIDSISSDGGKAFSVNSFEKFENKFSREDDIYRVEDARHNYIDCSPDHIHLVMTKDCRIVHKKTSELTTEDHLVMNLHPWLDSIKGESIRPELARFWGYMVSEGYTARVRKKVRGRKIQKSGYVAVYDTIKTGPYSFSNTDEEINEDFRKVFKSLYPDRNMSEFKDAREGRKVCTHFHFQFPEIYDLVQNNELNNKSSRKSVPSFILKSGKDGIREFLRALFSGDGGVSYKHFASVDYTSTSPVLTRQVQALLLGFGIPSSTKVSRYTTKDGMVGATYRIQIHGSYANKFHDEIGFIGQRSRAPRSNGKGTQNYDVLVGLLDVLRNSPFRSKYRLHITPPHTKSFTFDKIRRLGLRDIVAQYEPGHHIIETIDFVLSNKVQLIPVIGVNKVGRGEVHDWTVPSTSLFWANGYITHNCPRADTDWKKMIKNIFQVNEKGRVLVQLDYKANEMRWVGIAARDQAMAKKFLMGKEALDRYRKTLDPEDFKLASLYGDVHKQNASSAFKINIEDVTKDQRQAAKGVSFGVLYDSSEKSVSELYGMTLEDTVAMFQGFYETHHAIYGWKMEMKEMARQKGYVEAPHGRRRRFPIFDLYRDASGWFDPNAVPREHQSLIADALRQASNAPIQGIASDAANIGAHLLQNYIKRNKKDWRMCNVVHDSAIVDTPFDDLEEYVTVAEPIFTTDVMDYMEGLWGIDFILPLEVDFDFGLKWGDMKAWDFSPSGLQGIKSWLGPQVQ